MAGFDLSIQEHRVLLRRVFFGRFAPRLAKIGLEPEEVYQIVCCSMVVRDQGSRPFQISMGTRSNYAWMVCRSVCSHAVERHLRDAPVSILGLQRDASLDQGS